MIQLQLALHHQVACQIRARLRGESLFIISSACRLLTTPPRFCHPSLFLCLSFWPFLFLDSFLLFLQIVLTPQTPLHSPLFPLLPFSITEQCWNTSFFFLPFPSVACSLKIPSSRVAWWELLPNKNSFNYNLLHMTIDIWLIFTTLRHWGGHYQFCLNPLSSPPLVIPSVPVQSGKPHQSRQRGTRSLSSLQPSI